MAEIDERQKDRVAIARLSGILKPVTELEFQLFARLKSRHTKLLDALEKAEAELNQVKSEQGRTGYVMGKEE